MAYCLGQIDDVYALPILQRVLENEEEHPMVRHEVRTRSHLRQSAAPSSARACSNLIVWWLTLRTG